MKSLVLSSPDLVDRRFTGLFERVPVRFVLPCSGNLPEFVPGSSPHRVHNLHQKILRDRQKTWFQRVSFDSQVPEIKKYEEELAAILDNMGDNWLVQSALLNHFLPLWLSRVDKPVVMLYFSEPLECAVTLQQKWRFPIAFGLALWESYMLTAVNHLAGHRCILVSRNRLRNRPQEEMASILRYLDDIPHGDENTWAAFSIPPLEGLSAYSAFLQDSQREIFTHLENGEIERLQGRALAPQSADILEYYGHLRAGFEMLKARQDRTQELAGRYSDSAETISGNVVRQDEMCDEFAGSLSKVTVYIKGVEPIQFVAQAGSPVLDMLRRAMHSTAQMSDEMLYLNYKIDETSAFYFMKSSLLGLETEPVIH